MAITEQDMQAASGGLTELYRRYGVWLAGRVRRAGWADPEDVVQETFLRAAAYGGSAEIRHPRALLLAIARNVVRTAVRRERADRERIASVERQPAADGVDAGSFEAVLLRQVVLALPEAERDVFVMHRFGGMSYAQIAQSRGLSVKTVEWRMSRALSLCAARMRE